MSFLLLRASRKTLKTSDESTRDITFCSGPSAFGLQV